MICEVYQCTKESVRVKRDLLEIPHWFCDEHCSNSVEQNLLKTSSPTQSEQTDPSLYEEHGEVYHRSSKVESEIESEKKTTLKFTQQQQNEDTGTTQNDSERHTMNHGNEESQKNESETEYALARIGSQTHLTKRSEASALNYEEDLSQSNNLVTDSIQSMHELLISVRDNIREKNKKSEFPHVDPAQVNSAVNCAREMANLMKLKLQVAKDIRSKK